MYRALNTASYYLDRVCRVCAASFFITMIVLVIFQVIARYVFRAVPVWTEEAARYCMVWGGLLGATIAFRADVDPRLIPPPVSRSPMENYDRDLPARHGRGDIPGAGPLP